ncbi:MAG: hypothetical protein WCJ45_01160 [bacterium]
MTSVETDSEDPLAGSGNACTVDNTSISIDIPLHTSGAKVKVDSCDIEYSGDTKIITIPEIDVTVMTDLSDSPVSVQIPQFTRITSDLNFDYNIFTPTVKENSSVTAGTDQTVQSVIELGYAS